MHSIQVLHRRFVRSLSAPPTSDCVNGSGENLPLIAPLHLQARQPVTMFGKLTQKLGQFAESVADKVSHAFATYCLDIVFVSLSSILCLIIISFDRL